MKISSYFGNNIEVLLLALVICINCIRVVLGLGETTTILYGLYLLCLMFLIAKYKNSFQRVLNTNGTVKKFLLFIILILIYASFSLLWIPLDAVFSTYLKFILSLGISTLTVAMPIEKIKRTLNSIIVINVVYALILILFPNIADRALGSGLNYLNATLPLGLALTMTLIKSLNAISKKEGGLIMSILWIAISALYFVALVGFVARGVLLFPPIIALLIFIFMKNERRYVTLLLIPLFLGVLYLFFTYYLENANGYAASRMLNLLESTEEEDRWELWSKALFEIENRLWFIFGGGIEAFRYDSAIHFYPHNIFIQIIGEYGLLGIIISSMTLWHVLKGFIQSRILASQIHESDVLYCVTGAFAYYTLTFCKSFSLYDGLPLFIIIAFCLSVFGNLRKLNRMLPIASKFFNA